LALLALHTPPKVRSESVIVVLGQTFESPVIVPAVGTDTTFTLYVAMSVPQEFVTLYEITTAPTVTPVTTPPPETVALALLAVHEPPAVPVVASVTVPATHTFAEPEIAPANGRGLMVAVFITVVVPHPLVRA
jgi:hypothetical protein